MLDTIDQKMNDWNGSLFVYIDFDHFIILEFWMFNDIALLKKNDNKKYSLFFKSNLRIIDRLEKTIGKLHARTNRRTKIRL